MFLLRETDRSVTDICLDVGFTSLGTFSRTFRDDRRRVADGLPPARAHVPSRADVLRRWPGRDRAVLEKRSGSADD